MLHLQNKADCCGCSACAQSCPKGCIAMRPDEEGFLYPAVNAENCIACGLCEAVCPVIQVQQEPKGRTPAAFAAYNRDENVREASSSGGVFTLLAEQVLARGGVVFGAAMTNDCRKVHHIMVENADELAALRGSKYLQSEIGHTYGMAKRVLDAGRPVLFTGTPCQIEGLQMFLRHDYPDLLCMDVICHGVPSQTVWESYVRYRERGAGAPARRTFFRHKKYGWKTYAVLFEFSNNTAYEQILSKDLFMQTFLKNVCLRPSCYNCKFKKLNRVSDLTVADFWGCGSVCPELDDDKGLSLVLTHTEKGAAALREAEPRMVCVPVDTAQALRGNPAMTSSCKKPPQRDAFMGDAQAVANPACWPDYFPRSTLTQRLRDAVPRPLKEGIKRVLGK